ncbi:MAG: recombination and repair protein [Frankiales bacterium]|nr:recombination and repair protein [Frankiales bacterium]
MSDGTRTLGPVLEEMRIQVLGVIDEAVLELSPGLTVVTGETGAGKTMVVQGLSLLFGGRGDAGRVRPGATRAVVEGRLLLGGEHPAVQRALDAGGELDDGVLLLSRSVAADGRSRAHVGGRGVPVGVLGELAESLLAVHGQDDQQRLLKPARQRDALDRFGGPPVAAALAVYGEQWIRWRGVRDQINALTAARDERGREAAVLRAGLEAIEAAAPQPGEDETLRAEIRRHDAADELRAASSGASEALTGLDSGEGADALGLLTTARRALEGAAGADPVLAGMAARVAEASLLVADVAADVASYASSVDVDPARMAAAQDRLAELTALTRRWAPDGSAQDVDAVLAWGEAASVRLLELEGTDDRLEQLHAEDEALVVQVGDLAVELTTARVAAAETFGAAVSAELAELAMPHAAVSAAVTQREDLHGLPVGERRLVAGPLGVDDVELLLAPHPGAPPRALNRGASGGELSRVMLAVEVVFAGADPVPVMVFDEVDAGVGGRAAVEVGRRLARLARDHQVLVVTHLPQVAAFADTHLLVVKSDDGSVTSSGVVRLDDQARVAELSRMLAGLDSGLARGHAEELLASSKALVAQDAG